MRIRWTTQAAEDIVGIVRHIQEENPTAAQQVAEQIFGSLQNLTTFPRMGRPGEQGARELVTGPYIVIYRVAGGFIELLHIWHGAQNWR